MIILRKLAVAFMIFMAGFILAPNGTTNVEYKVDETREKNWVQLKDVDDNALGLASRGFGYCADFANAVSEFDTEAMASAGASIDSLAIELDSVATQRSGVLKLLGY